MPVTWHRLPELIKLAFHHTRHEDGGDDEIDVTGLSGLLADDQHVLSNEIDYGLSFEGVVTTYTDTTHFKVATLADKGTGAFKPASGAPYEIFVFQADGAAPEGEQTPVVAYTSSDGTFQHAAFSVPLAVGDIVLIIHPLLASLGTKATAVATGAVTTTDYAMAYIKQLVTLLLNATYGLSALKNYLVTTVYGNIQSILVDYLAHGTWGLAAIRSALQLVQTKTDNIYGGVGSIITDYLGHGTWGLSQIRAALQLVQTDADQIDANVLSIINDHLSQMKTNLVRWGQISDVSGNTFTSAHLAGLGVDAMPGWWVYVMQADDAAPEGEYRLMTDYTNAGVVTHNAFSTALAIGDRVQLMHPSLLAAQHMRGGVEGIQDIKEALDAQLDTARGKYTKTMTGGEDDLYGESSDTEFRLEEFRVDLHNMEAGDTIVFKVYTTEDGTERKISDDTANTFTGAQAGPPRVEIIGSANQVWGREDISITAEQTAGTNREIVCYWRDSKRGG